MTCCVCLYFLIISHSEMGPCQAVQAGLVQPGEEKTLRYLMTALQSCKEDIEKMEPSSSQELIAGVVCFQPGWKLGITQPLSQPPSVPPQTGGMEWRIKVKLEGLDKNSFIIKNNLKCRIMVNYNNNDNNKGKNKLCTTQLLTTH